jgi:hypothetical protein
VSSWKRQVWISIVGGIVVSGALFGLNFAISPDHHPAFSRIVFTAQYPGWIARAYLVPGSFESATASDYIAIAMPVNAALYAIFIFVALRLFSHNA